MAIINFYDSQLDIPKKVLCTDLLESKELICKVLKKKFNANVQITHSPSKSIRPIYNLCKLNAKQIIENHLSKSDKYNFAFDDLKNHIGHKKNIKKIEAYDVSHISGNHAVASCIVFSNEGPCKKEYRIFNIPKELSGNDVGSLEHVMQRRIKYYDNKDTKPDLILIDGGANQLNFSQSVIHNSEHNDIKVISIVKGINRIRATETVLSKDGVIEFNKDSKGYLLLQEIRDESHRFAINAQRKKKNAKNRKSQLDNIEGIGEVLKKRLLLNFKSLKNIKSAKIEDLMTVKGINAKIAQLIKEKL
jgi:excinuclease ABC subunit C